MPVEIPDEIREEYRRLSTSELTKRFSESSSRLDHIANGRQYSDDEVKKVQEEFGGAYNTGTGELARQHLLINDVIEQVLTAQALEERRKVG